MNVSTGRPTANPMAILMVLGLGTFVTLLDLTIVNIAIPSILDGIHASLDQILWVLNAYSLAYAVLLITSGRLGDIFGPRNLFVIGMGVFTAASLLSGIAQDPTQLILARATQGLGAAILAPQGMAILLSVLPPERRGVSFAVFGILTGLAVVAGPTVGGFLVTHFGWRWIFYVNLPLGIFALAMLASTLPRVRRTGTVNIDWLGIILLVAAVVPFLIGLTWAGITYPWSSVQVITTLGAGALLGIVFLIHENRTREPILSLHLFENRTFTVAVILSFLIGIALFGSLTFLPLYAQGVKGQSAQDAGLILAPLMVGFVVGSFVGGQLLSRTGRYKVQAIIGMAVTVIGMFSLGRLDADSSWALAITGMVITGIGVGAVFPILSIAVQSAFPYRLLGTANSGRQFFNNLGSVIGVPVMTTIVLESFQAELPGHLPAAAARALAGSGQNLGEGLVSGVGQSALSHVPGLPAAAIPTVVNAIRVSLATGVQRAFLLSAVLAAMGFLVTFFLPEIPLRHTVHGETTAPAPAAPL